MNLTRKVSNLSIKSTDDGSREITGYASTFGGVDSWGDTIAPGAFTETIQAHQVSDTPVPILFEHNRGLDSHVGEVLEMREDEHGLFIRAALDSSPAGEKAYNLVKGRRINGLSIGFYPVEVSATEIDGQPVNEIAKADLAEISLVLTPADAGARITSVKAAETSSSRDPEVVIPAARLEELSKSLESDGDLGAFYATVERQRDLLNARAAADAYRDALLNNGDVYKTGAMELPAEERSRIEMQAIRAIVGSSKAKGAGLSRDDAERIDRIKGMPAVWERAAQPTFLEMFRYKTPFIESDLPDTFSGPSGLDSASSYSERNDVFPVTKSHSATLATRAVDTVKKKSLVGAASGDLYIATEISQSVVTDGRPVHNLLDLIPGQIVDGPSLTYYRQTERDLRADIVPVGATKPESRLGFERVDTSLEPVAHLVRGIDKYVLQDLRALRNVISQEMICGVADRLETWTVQELLGSTGHRVENFTTDPFTTTRLGISRLQTLGLEASAVILHPTTWALMETARVSGDGQFVFNGAPVNQEQRLLWGVPVATSTAVPENTGIAVDLTSVEVFTDGRMELAWNVSGDEFSRNQLSIRAEVRARPAVIRTTGVVELLLDADAKPSTARPYAPTAPETDPDGPTSV